KMEGGTWREGFEVWPGALVSGGSFAIVQFLASRTAAFHLITDVVAGVVSIIITALFLRFVWHPKTRFLLKRERVAAPASGAVPAAENGRRYTLREIAVAWTPWAILIACCALWGSPAVKKTLNAVSQPVIEMPALHNLVQRMPPVAPPDAKPEAARFTVNWLSAAGTGVFVAALLSGLLLRLTLAQWRMAIAATARRMRVPVLVIAQVLGLGFLTRYSGADAVLGLAFTSAGVAYPFFAAYLGWLGVFLTGSDTASNALFGSLQRITAQQLHLSETLIVA